MLRINIHEGPKYAEVLPSNIEVSKDGMIIISRTLKSKLMFVALPGDASFKSVQNIVKLDNETFEIVAQVQEEDLEN